MSLFKRRNNGGDRPHFPTNASVESAFHQFVARVHVVAPDVDARPAAESWDAVFALDEWHFLPAAQPGERTTGRSRGDRDGAPLTTLVDGSWHIVVFTSAERAAAAARAHGAPMAGAGYRVRSMTREDAASYLCSLLHDDVEAVLVDPGPDRRALSATLNDLAVMYERRFDHLPLPMFDRYARAAMETRSNEMYDRLDAYLARLDHLYFVGDPEIPRQPMMGVVNGQVVVYVFTDKECALRGAQASDAFPDGRIPMIGMTMSDALATLGDIQRVSEAHGRRIADMVVNLGRNAYMTGIDDLRRRVELRGGSQR